MQPLRRTGALRREHDAVALAGERAQPARRARRRRRPPGRTRSPASARRVGAVGCRQHRHRTAPVCASRRSKSSESRGRSRSAPAPHVTASVAASEASSSSSSWARSRMRFGSTSSAERGVGQQVGEQVLAVGEPRQPRLHAVEQLAVGQPLPLLAAPRLRAHAAGGALAHLVGRQQLARREDPRLVDVVGRALVGDRERRQAVDLVAPEVDAHRMVVGRRVHVDDRAAHRELAARLDLVLAPVAAGDEALDQLVAVDPVARPHDDRLDSSTCGPSRCTSARTGATTTAAACPDAQPPHHAQAAAHRLERRRHPLERQRLPRREAARPSSAPRNWPQVAHEALGLGAGRHREEQRPAGGDVGQRRPRTAPGPRRAPPPSASRLMTARSAGSSARSGARPARGGVEVSVTCARTTRVHGAPGVGCQAYPGCPVSHVRAPAVTAMNRLGGLS